MRSSIAGIRIVETDRSQHEEGFIGAGGDQPPGPGDNYNPEHGGVAAAPGGQGRPSLMQDLKRRSFRLPRA